MTLNNECLRHAISRIQNKDHGIRRYEISMYIRKNGYDGLALGYLDFLSSILF